MKKVLFGLLVLGNASSFAMSTNVFLNEAGEKSYLITNPTHNGSNLPFSYYSDGNGVCRALGYEKAVADSGRVAAKADTVKVSSSGQVVSGPFNPVMKQIVCLNKYVKIKEYSIKIVNPQHLDSKLPFSFYSDDNGVCISLGYERAAVQSSRPADKADTIKVSSTGAVMAGPFESALKQIVCLDNK